MKIASAIAAILVFLPLAASAQTLRIADATIPPGQTGDVSIVLDDAFGLGGLDLLIRFDPAVLRFESVVEGTTGETFDFNGVSHRPGEIRIALVSSARMGGVGSPLQIRFTAIGAAGTSSKIDIVAGQAINAETALKMTMGFVGGKVTVGEPLVVPIPPTGSPGIVPITDQPAVVAATQPGDDAPGPASVQGWEPDTDLMLNLAIATTGGLLILVLLIALFYAIRRKPAGAAQAEPDAPAAGASAPPATCPSCGQSLIPNARFCPQCGRKM